MKNDNRKIALIGTGSVGTSFAYAALNQSLCDEMVLIDIDKKRAQGETMDLNHGLAFSGGNMLIRSGDYADASDADIAVICAGVSQKPGESRRELLKRNNAVFRSVIGRLLSNAFSGIILVATNPVDAMTYAAAELSGFEKSRVFGTGTSLDTARLKYLLGSAFGFDPRNVHAYVMGEHGDSEFIPWSQVRLSACRINAMCQTAGVDSDVLEKIASEVKSAAAKIIEAKGATYYGIGMAAARIVRAVFGNENSVFTVSAYLSGEYGITGTYAGVPCIIGRDGVKRVLVPELNDDEKEKMKASANVISAMCGELFL